MPSPAPTVAKPPFLAAAGFFGLLAGFIAHTAIRPLGAADLLGMGACVAAAASLVTIPFALDFARSLETRSETAFARAPVPVDVPPPAPVPAFSPEALQQAVGAAVEAHLAAALPAWSEQLAAALAAAEEKHREEVLRALTAANAAPVRTPDTDAIAAPAGAKPRLGRGLLGLIHGPGAITPPAAPAPERDAA